MTVETFGRYQLIRLAGTGGMAQVHLARRIGSEGFIKPCVLKRIAPEQAHDPSIRQMFMEEARLTALLNHPNVVQTFDFGELQGVPYLAMELVDGVNLAQLCRTLNQRERWLPLTASVDIVLALLEALEYAHTLQDLDGRPLNLVHRDVSPQNTLLSRQGAVKLADFGIARHDAREAATIGTNVKGKPGYMSPEQAMGAVVDARADLFSVGIILAELIAARRVLARKDRVKGLLEVEVRVRELCRERPGTPPELVEFTTSMARLEPEARPPTAADAARALRRIRASIEEGPPLPDFLRSVFQTYLDHPDAPGTEPDDEWHAPEWPHTGTRAPQSRPPSGPRPPTGEWEAPPPAAGEATGTAADAVYGRGWPSRFLPEEPPAPLDLVKHSSSVEAMQFFGAQFSDELLKRSTEDIAVSDPAEEKAPRRPYVFPSRRGPMTASTDLPAPGAAAPPPDAPKKLFALSNPKLEQALKTIDSDPSKKGAKRPIEIPPVLYLLVAGLAVTGIGVGILALAAWEREKRAPPKPPFGTLAITSSPPGGRVIIDGRDTGRRTPAELGRFPVSTPMRVAVRMDGYQATPPDVVVRIPRDGQRSVANFLLRPGRQFRVESTPPEATVTVNDHRVGDVTPVVLAVIPYGETASVSVTLEGYMPGFIRLKSLPGTATVAHVRLEPGRHIEISSNPPGAQVRIDGRRLGQTPLYDILVPVDRRFTLQLRHPGFRPWRRRISGARAKQMIVADLRPKDFLSLPWSRAERSQAQQLNRAHRREKQRIVRLRRALKRAEAGQRRVESSLGATVGDLADVQRRTDLARDRLLDAENTASELASRMDSMRQVLLLRMESE